MTDETKKADAKARFDAYVMLSEPVQFNTREIAQALAEDYPSLEAEDRFSEIGDGFDCDTSQFVTAPLMMVDGPDANNVLLVRLPGYGTWDPAAIRPWQTLSCPDIADRLTRNRSYICVSVSTSSDKLTDRFRAARLSSCVAAIFARLPVAVAVYWENGDHFISPENTIRMADDAISGNWPVKHWIGQNLSLNPAYDPPAPQSCSRGLRQFVDYEISYAAAPVPAADAGAMVWTVAEMALAYGNRFEDGHTIGNEGQSPEESYRIRRAPVGYEGLEHELLVLFHPGAYPDHQEMFGPLTNRPHPDPAQRKVQPNEGFFKRMLHGMRPN